MPITLNPSSQPLTFKAVWSEQNKHLEESIIEKITRYALYLINRIATASILPSSTITRDRVEKINNDFDRDWQSHANHFLRKNFTTNPIEVTTPDNIPIKGTFF